MIWVQEQFVNRTEHYLFGNDEPYESGYERVGDLFKAEQREYGRCVSRVYIDREGKPPLAIGWVFEKRLAYEDDPQKFYVREAWITLHKAPPIKTTKYQYLAS